MRVDLLVPKFPPAHWNFAFAMELEGSLYSHPPLGAATLAAYVPEGVEVRILDENVEPVELEQTAPLVMISSMYIQRHRAFELAGKLRALGRTVAVGGGLVGSLPEECASRFDVCFHGEGELSFPAFLEDFAAGRRQARYDAPERFDLSRSRVPRYDLLKARRYSTGSVQTSRGCPYRCEYCDVPLIDGTRPRNKPIAIVMQEIQALWDLGLRSVFFVDDHFLGNRKYALELLSELARFGERTGHKMSYYCQATINVATDAQALEALYRADFRRLFIGLESDNVEALRTANKHHNTKMDIKEAIARIQRHNLTVWAALLVGFDEDTPEVFDRYLRFAREAGIGMVIPGILQAVPGTDYHQRLEKEGRLRPLRNGHVGGQSGSLDSLLVTNIEPKKMSYDELIAGYRRLVRAFYEYDEYADRVFASQKAGEREELGSLGVAEVKAGLPILGRVARYYLSGDSERRRFFLRFMRHLVATRFRRADELVFHLLIYKHLREFYFTTAAAGVPLASDLGRLAHAS